MVAQASRLKNVRYDIRGPVLRRAQELEAAGHQILKLNLGNPAPWGLHAPEPILADVVHNLPDAQGYSDARGIYSARVAVAQYYQTLGVRDVQPDDVFLGNGVSELIVMSLQALLNSGDEVLVPSPDYPLWTAAVTLNRGRAVHYPCRPENGFEPDPRDIEALITSRTRAIVVINPNNPTGAVYSRATLQAIARLAEQHHLVVFSDEIYDQIMYCDAEFVPMATLVNGTLCATLAGLSKVYRACGYRVGWAVFSGEIDQAGDYLNALDKLSSLRLCSNVPGQWAVQTALGGYQSIYELTRPGGRLFQSRQAILDGVAASKYLQVHAPRGAIYAFVGVKDGVLPGFDDQQFAMDLLEHKHVLLAPGTSFNTPYNTHFRITNLPRPEVLADVFRRMEELLDSYAAGAEPVSRPAPELRIITK
jgi:alanine-synthesizing transaminase